MISCLAGAALGIVSGRIVAELTDRRPYYTIWMHLADDYKRKAKKFEDLLDQIEKVMANPMYERFKERDKEKVLRIKEDVLSDIDRLKRGEQSFLDGNGLLILRTYGCPFEINRFTLKLRMRQSDQ